MLTQPIKFIGGQMFRLTLASTILLATARADEPAVAFDVSTQWNLGSGVGVYGWQFTPKSDIEISALGVYDDAGNLDGGTSGDGLRESHAIAVWDVSNPSIPVMSAVIPDGKNAALAGGFRYVVPSPQMLRGNHDYVIAAVYHLKDWTIGKINNPSFTLTANPEISVGGYRSSNAGDLSFPSTYNPGEIYGFGPNFTFHAVPEPSATSLFVLGCTALFGTAGLRLLRALCRADSCTRRPQLTTSSRRG